jgi:peptidoglycan/xylan/chitin deacetylase (PgdA/CDA1 family)
VRGLTLAAIALVLAPVASAHPQPWYLHARRAREPDRRPVPILEYHALGPVGPGYPELYLSRRAFTRQIDWLARHHYQPVTLDRTWAAWHGRARLPARPVVLTFDDGYPGDWRVALPVLRRRHWRGVLNLQVGALLPKHVRDLVAAGWEVDPHTFTHPDLTTASGARLRHEITESRASIRAMFDVAANFFCYPSGRYDRAVVAEVRRAGYHGAETERYGLARPRQRYGLDRIEILASDGLAGFVRKLRDAR